MIRKFIEDNKMAKAFWSNVCIGNSSECWNWKGSVSPEGYGRFRCLGAQTVASRDAWEISNLEHLGKRIACHTCDNPTCCNPSHIYAGTPKSNINDAVTRGRLRNGRQEGESHTSAKLSHDDISIIRSRLSAGETPHQISKNYPVSATAIHKIKNGSTWKNKVEDESQ